MDSSINYKPSRKQLLFHQIKDKQIKVLLCGVGFGKTTALVMDLFKKMYQGLIKRSIKICDYIILKFGGYKVTVIAEAISTSMDKLLLECE